MFDQSSYFNLSWLQPDIATNVVAHTISRTSEVDEFQTPATRFLAVEDVAKRWFGNVSSHDFLLPLLRRFFGSESELSGFALELLNLTRLHVADRATWQLHSHNDNFRARVAFPDQRNLPMALRHTRKSLYPVGGSTADFVEGFRRLLRERGIRLLESTSIQEIRREKNEVDIHADGVATTIKFQKCFSTLGPSVTLRLMGLSKPSVIRRVSSRFVHHLVSRPTTSDVCYAYEMSSENPVFRVTNYRAFSGQSDDCRLTTEIISPNQLSDMDAIQAAELALRSSDLLGGGQVTRSAVLSTAVGFPVPTVAVFDQFYDDSEQIEMLEDESFLVTGVGAKGNVYFQNEILRHLFGQVSRW